MSVDDQAETAETAETAIGSRVPVRRALAWWVLQVLRWVLAVGLLLSLVGGLWLQPVTGTRAGLRSALADGRVVTVSVVTHPRSTIVFGLPWRLPDRQPPTPYVEWTGPDRRVHDVSVKPAPGGLPDSSIGGDGAQLDSPIGNAQDLPVALQREITAWQSAPHRATDEWAYVLAQPLGLLPMVCLLLLVAGPRTVRGTKWAWFWFMGFVPFGLGVLAWLAFEAPWSRRLLEGSGRQTADVADAEVAEDAPRRSGWVGLGWGVLTAVVANAIWVLATS